MKEDIKQGGYMTAKKGWEKEDWKKAIMESFENTDRKELSIEDVGFIPGRGIPKSLNEAANELASERRIERNGTLLRKL